MDEGRGRGLATNRPCALEEGKAILEPTGVVPCHNRKGVTLGHPVASLGNHRDPDARIDLVLDGGSSGA